MRAKEYLSQNQQTVKHLVDVKRIIKDLMPLRLDKEATDDYYNKILSADIRRQEYLLQKDLYDKNNAMQLEAPVPQTYPDEIPIETIAEIRESLFQAIKEDSSFGYLFYILGTGINLRHKAEPIDCIPNRSVIEKAINSYRDDYPKESLDLYLDDSFNYSQYDYLISSGLYQDNNDTILAFFNKAYSIYDEIRCLKNKVSQVRQYCNSITFEDEKEKVTIILFVIRLIDTFEPDDTQLERSKKELSKSISDIRNKYENEESRTKSKLHLCSKKGYKVNFIRVVNVLYELGFFQGESNERVSKKEVFASFGDLLNANYSSFQNDLTTTQSASNSDLKCLTEIFEKMLEKQKELINK